MLLVEAKSYILAMSNCRLCEESLELHVGAVMESSTESMVFKVTLNERLLQYKFAFPLLFCNSTQYQ